MLNTRNEYGKKMKSSWSNNKNVSIVVLWKNTLFSPLTNTYTCTTFSMDIGLKLLTWNAWLKSNDLFEYTVCLMLYLIVFVGDYGGFFVIVVDEVGRGRSLWTCAICLFVCTFEEGKNPPFFFNLFVIWYSSIWY